MLQAGDIAFVHWHAEWAHDGVSPVPAHGDDVVFDPPTGGKVSRVLIEEGFDGRALDDRTESCKPPEGHVWVRTIDDALPWADRDWGVAAPITAVRKIEAMYSFELEMSAADADAFDKMPADGPVQVPGPDGKDESAQVVPRSLVTCEKVSEGRYRMTVQQPGVN